MMPSGIYQIRNTLNEKCYIGSATHLQQRWAAHRSTLRRGQHRNRHLQRAFDKYGKEAFTFTILEYVEEPEILIEREQYYFDTLKPKYNIAPIAGNCLGVQHTAEACAKMSAAKMGEQNPNYGKHRSKETLAKISTSMTGKQNPNYGKHPSEETLAKMSASKTGERNHNYGKHLSEKIRMKIRTALTGERHPNYGKHLSEDTRRKMGEAKIGERHPFYGKHRSAATKRKISVAMTAYWRRVREAKKQ